MKKEASGSTASGSGEKTKSTTLSLEVMTFMSEEDALEMPGFLQEGDLLEQMEHDDADIEELHDLTFVDADDILPIPGPNL